MARRRKTWQVIRSEVGQNRGVVGDDADHSMGRDLGSLQAAPAVRPEMAGMIALAVLRSPAARHIFYRLGYR